MPQNYFKNCSNEKQAKDRYKELAKKYHPDSSQKDTTSKMQIINAQYDEFIDKGYVSPNNTQTSQNRNNNKHQNGAKESRYTYNYNPFTSRRDKEKAKRYNRYAEQFTKNHLKNGQLAPELDKILRKIIANITTNYSVPPLKTITDTNLPDDLIGEIHNIIDKYINKEAIDRYNMKTFKSRGCYHYKNIRKIFNKKSRYYNHARFGGSIQGYLEYGDKGLPFLQDILSILRNIAYDFENNPEKAKQYRVPQNSTNSPTKTSQQSKNGQLVAPHLKFKDTYCEKHLNKVKDHYINKGKDLPELLQNALDILAKADPAKDYSEISYKQRNLIYAACYEFEDKV